MGELEYNSPQISKDQALTFAEMKLPGPDNSFKATPIDSVADDILLDIFLLNATLCDPSSYNRAVVTTACSQVCVRWRFLALNYPAIWGCIIDFRQHSLQWIETFLCRSSPSLFDFGGRTKQLDLSIRQDDELSVLELVFNHISRLRIFHFRAQTRGWELVRSRFLQQPAPNLEFLGLTPPFNTISVLKDPLFDNYAPMLRNLQLRRCLVDFTSPILAPLTELYVHRTISLHAEPTVLNWLNILGEMPFLRWITIIHAISGSTASSAFPTIHLTSLEMLSVEGELHETVTLIGQLIISPRCGLRLCCDRAHIGSHQGKLWAIIEKKMDFWETNTPNRRLEVINDKNTITIGNLRNLECIGNTGAEVLRYGRDLPLDPILGITLRSPNSQEIIPLFLSLFGLFNWTFFTTTFLRLWVDYRAAGGTGIFPPLVNRCLPTFGQLQKLYLKRDSHSFLFPLLRHASSPGSVLLPLLHTLMFAAGDFGHGSGSLASIAMFLEWRRQQGFPISKIIIIESRIDREYIQSQLRDVEVVMDSTNDVEFGSRTVGYRASSAPQPLALARRRRERYSAS